MRTLHLWPAVKEQLQIFTDFHGGVTTLTWVKQFSYQAAGWMTATLPPSRQHNISSVHSTVTKSTAGSCWAVLSAAPASVAAGCITLSTVSCSSCSWAANTVSSSCFFVWRFMTGYCTFLSSSASIMQIESSSVRWGNKLHSIYPMVGIVKHSKNISCYDSVLLNRLQIGHSRLTHSYLLSGDDSQNCQSCGIPLTVKHILVECANLRDIREKYFTMSSLADLFNRFDNHTVLILSN